MGSWAPPELEQGDLPAPSLPSGSWAPDEYHESQMLVPSNGEAALQSVTPATIFTDGNSIAAPLNGSKAGVVPSPSNPVGTDDLENVKQATAMTGQLMQIVGGKALDFVGQGIHSLGKIAESFPDPYSMSWATQPGDSPITELGGDIHKAASSLVDSDPVLRDSWIGKGSGSAGTVAGMVGASLINPTAATALFAGGSGEELANAAERDGQPQQVIDEARGVGTLLGAAAAMVPLHQISSVFARYNINPYVRNLAGGLMEVLPKASVQKRLLYTGIEAAKSGTIGSTVGAGYQLGMNALQNAFTGPDGQVPLDQGVAGSAAMFGIPSAIAGGIAPWQRAGTVFDREPFIDQPVQVTTSQAPIADLPSQESASGSTRETSPVQSETKQLGWSPAEAEESAPAISESPAWVPPEAAEESPVTIPIEQTGSVSEWQPPELSDAPVAETGDVSLQEPITEHGLDQSLYPIQEVPISELSLSSDVPNFKDGADPETGVVKGNELSGPYIRLGTAPIVAWQRINGNKEVITGRHKFDLAGRNGEATIPTQIVHESQGFSKQDALTLDAESNIRDGQGTVSDYANYFRNSQIDQQSAESSGLLSRAKGRSGFALGRSASDDLYALYQAGKLPETKAVAISLAAPGNAALQQVGMKRAHLLSAAEIPGYLAIVARQTPPEAQQVGLFGDDDAALNQAESLSKAAAAKVREITDQISAVQGAQKRPEAAAKLGVNVKDPVALAVKLGELKSLRDRYSQFWLHNDLLESLGAKPVASSIPTIATHGEGNLFQESEMPFNLSGQVESGQTPGELAEAQRLADLRAEQDRNQQPLFDGGASPKPSNSPNARRARAFIAQALDHPNLAGELVYRPVSPREISDVLAQGGPDISGMNHVLDAYHIQHSLKEHSDPLKEAGDNQRPITRADLLRIPDVLDHYDSLYYRDAGHNRKSLIYKKSFQDGRVEYIERIFETSERYSPRLITKTAWVKSETGVKPSSPPVYTRDRQGNDTATPQNVNPQPDAQPPSAPSYKDQSNTAASSKSSAQNSQTPITPAPAPTVAGQSPAQQKRGWMASIRAGWNAHVSLPLARTFFPASIDEAASRTALILRHLNGDKQIALQRADHALSSWRNEFDRTPVPRSWRYDPLCPLPHNHAVIHAIETGNLAGLTPELQEFVSVYRGQLARLIDIIHQYAPNALQVLHENYFSHVWKDRNAADIMRAAYPSKSSLEGSKGFLKQRTYTYFTDGLKAGLTPVSDNPVDIHLFKLAEMEQFIMAHKFHEQAKAAGLLKFVGVFQQPPAGWSKVDDKSFTVYAPPWVTVKEAFDQSLRQGAIDFIKKMGWNLNRTFEGLKAAGFKQNHWGQWSPADDTITIRPFGADSTIFHEIGHGLDHHYGLSAWINQRVSQDVQEAELSAMSLARDPKAKGKHKIYVNSREERMAELTAGYVHAPELLHQLAPQTAAAYKAFLDAHPELHDLRDLRPGLQRGVDSVQVPVHGMVTLGYYYMPDGGAQVVNNFLSPGLQNNAWYRGIKSISNLMNAAELGLSAFHLGFTSGDAAISQVSVGIWQLLHGHPVKAAAEFITAPAAPVTNFVRGWQLQKAMLSPGKSVAQIQALADLAVQGGLRATMDPFWKTEFTRSLRKSLAGLRMNLSQGNVLSAGGDATRAMLNMIPAVVEQMMRPIAEGIVPRQKLGVFAKLMQVEIQRLGPNATPEQLREAAARCADTTEDRMGQMTYDNLFHNRVAKDLMLIAFRAYGWQLGKYRAMAMAAGEAAGAVKSIASGKAPTISTNLTYIPALLIVAGILGAIIQKLYTGKNPESPMDYFFPRSGNRDLNGREQRLALPTYLKDLVSDWHDFPDAKKMSVSIWHKMNPIFSTVADMLNNKDFYGVEIRHDDDPAWKQALQLVHYLGKAFIPFSITGMQKLGDSGASADQYILPFIGIVPAKAALTMSPAEARAMDLYSGTMPQGSRTQEQADHSKLVGQLRNAFTKDPRQGMQAISANLSKLHGTDLGAILKDGGKPVIVSQVSRLTVDQAMSVWDLSNGVERQELQPVIMRQLGNAIRNRAIPPDRASIYARALMNPAAGR